MIQLNELIKHLNLVYGIHNINVIGKLIIMNLLNANSKLKN